MDCETTWEYFFLLQDVESTLYTSWLIYLYNVNGYKCLNNIPLLPLNSKEICFVMWKPSQGPGNLCIKFTHTGNLFSTNMNLHTSHCKLGVNYYTQHSILVHDSQPIYHRWIILTGNIHFDKFSHSNRAKVKIKVKVKFNDDLYCKPQAFFMTKLTLTFLFSLICTLTYMFLYVIWIVSSCTLSVGILQKKLNIEKCVIFL